MPPPPVNKNNNSGMNESADSDFATQHFLYVIDFMLRDIEKIHSQ